MMIVCNGVLLWQLREVRSQVELLKGVDGELIEVLRVHGELFSFYERLGVAARSEDQDQFITVSEALRNDVLEEARRTEAVFTHLPPAVKVDEESAANDRINREQPTVSFGCYQSVSGFGRVGGRTGSNRQTNPAA